MNELKNKYQTIEWIDPLYQTLNYLKTLNVDFTLGTILWELAYFKIHPISAGEHPACKYNIGFEPRSIDQYKNFIIH